MDVRESIVRWGRTYWRIIKYSSKRYVTDQLSQQAIVLTYYTLFSIVPLLALVFGITKGFGLDFPLEEFLHERFPANNDLPLQLCSIVQRTLENASGGLVAGVGVIALMWTVFWLITNIDKAFNVVWGLTARHSMLRKFSSYLSLVVLTPLMMVAVSTLGMMIRNHIQQLSIGASESAWQQLFWRGTAGVVPVLTNVILVFLIYWRVPSTRVRWQGALLAAVFIGIAFQILQDSFLFLQSSVFAYNRVYGSFALLPLFLIWMNWAWQLILIGAEISFVHQHLKSGVFNETRSRISNRLRREHQLAIIRQVFSAFESGAGPISGSDVAAALRVPDGEFQSELNELIDSGILCRTASAEKNGSLLPGMPPEKLKLLDVMKNLEGSGDSENPELARFEQHLIEIEELIEKNNLNAVIHHI